MRRKARQATKAENRPRFWGKHAVAAALANTSGGSSGSGRRARPRRNMTFRSDIPVTFADVADLGRLVPKDAPHQGIVAEVERLEDILLADLLDQAEDGRPLLVLDQVTDPHNVGAILRSAAAFGALGIVTQDRHAPPESGALAKAASRRAGDHALGARRQSRPRAGRHRGGGLLADRPDRRGRDDAGRGARPGPRRSRARRRGRGHAAEYRGALRRAGAAADQGDREPQRLQRGGRRALRGERRYNDWVARRPSFPAKYVPFSQCA